MIISTAQQEFWLNWIAVKANHFAAFLMNQNRVPVSLLERVSTLNITYMISKIKLISRVFIHYLYV